jgi:hypothetical protein
MALLRGASVNPLPGNCRVVMPPGHGERHWTFGPDGSIWKTDSNNRTMRMVRTGDPVGEWIPDKAASTLGQTGAKFDPFPDGTALVTGEDGERLIVGPDGSVWLSDESGELSCIRDGDPRGAYTPDNLTAALARDATTVERMTGGASLVTEEGGSPKHVLGPDGSHWSLDPSTGEVRCDLEGNPPGEWSPSDAMRTILKDGGFGNGGESASERAARLAREREEAERLRKLAEEEAERRRRAEEAERERRRREEEAERERLRRLAEEEAERLRRLAEEEAERLRKLQDLQREADWLRKMKDMDARLAAMAAKEKALLDALHDAQEDAANIKVASPPGSPIKMAHYPLEKPPAVDGPRKTWEQLEAEFHSAVNTVNPALWDTPSRRY